MGVSSWGFGGTNVGSFGVASVLCVDFGSCYNFLGMFHCVFFCSGPHALLWWSGRGGILWDCGDVL